MNGSQQKVKWITRGLPLKISACILLGAWHFLPLVLEVYFDIPPYAFGHESIGVRFMRAWRWLNDNTDYFFVPVGYLLDLIQRWLLAGLMAAGLRPEANVELALKQFAVATLAVHAVGMEILTAIVVFSKRLTIPTKIGLTVMGASLGYLFYWAPLRLFIPDYPLTMVLLAFVAIVSSVSLATDEQRGSWRLGPFTLLAALLVFLKVSLIVWVPFLLAVGTGAVTSARAQLRGMVRAATVAGGILVVMGFIGMNFHVTSVIRLVVDMLRFLKNRPGSDPNFTVFHEFYLPGSVYFVPALILVLWLGLLVASLVSQRAEHADVRILYLSALAGGVAYLAILGLRPTDGTVMEFLLYLVVSGGICATAAHGRVSLILLTAWCVVLGIQVALGARAASPDMVRGAAVTARVAADVDHYARSFGLPVFYVVPKDEDIFHSAATAIFRGAEVPQRDRHVVPDRRQAMVTRFVAPYHFVYDPDMLPETAFVLVYSEVPEIATDQQTGVTVKQLVARTTQCRQWQQWRHQIHVCQIPARV